MFYFNGFNFMYIANIVIVFFDFIPRHNVWQYSGDDEVPEHTRILKQSITAQRLVQFYQDSSVVNGLDQEHQCYLYE